MPKLTFYPLGNADCCLIDLANGKKILFDFADKRDPKGKDERRCDLPKELRENLEAAKRDSFDAVAFTHLDNDHYRNASNFFHLRHDSTYQSKDRIKIDLMWVPAAVITEDPKTLKDDEGRIIQKEARYRFEKGEGIRVFSRPQRLKDWCTKNGIDFESRKRLVTDAGWCAPDFSLLTDGVEFFVHSPFAKRLDETNVEDRNGDSIVMQATFLVGQVATKVLLMADTIQDRLSDIVDITRYHGREVRLEWDVAKLPHHCSYLSLAYDGEKGEDKTKPLENIKWLYEEQRQEGGIIVCTSWPIPFKGTKEDAANDPPHRQAANYYKQDVLDHPDAEFIVTMSHPNETAPKPLVIDIDGRKATVQRRTLAATAIATGRQAPRAGKSR
jgi:hypothetical protein